MRNYQIVALQREKGAAHLCATDAVAKSAPKNGKGFNEEKEENSRNYRIET